jgi:hypothetical protein
MLAMCQKVEIEGISISVFLYAEYIGLKYNAGHVL